MQNSNRIDPEMFSGKADSNSVTYSGPTYKVTWFADLDNPDVENLRPTPQWALKCNNIPILREWTYFLTKDKSLIVIPSLFLVISLLGYYWFLFYWIGICTVGLFMIGPTVQMLISSDRRRYHGAEHVVLLFIIYTQIIKT